MAMLWTPLNVMQGIYIKYYGFALGVMAAILLLSRVYDALMDVAVGILSDWVKRKTGRHRIIRICTATGRGPTVPWAMAAGILYGIRNPHDLAFGMGR